MKKLRGVIREHIHFIVVVSLLTLVMTFPTIIYVFRTDIWWLPTGTSLDALIHQWDVWYWEKILSGLAERRHTDVIFFPRGISLVHHPFASQPANTLQAMLRQIMPFTNAFNIAFLLVIVSNAFAGYLYALWLFKDKWIALVSSVVFAFCPHVVGNPNQLHDATIATIALAAYFFHRGIVDKSSRRIIAAGLLAGLTSTISLYNFSCLMIIVASIAFALAMRRWREHRYWRDVSLLALITAASSIWTIYPYIADTQTFDAALDFHGNEQKNDLVSSFVNHTNPLIGPPLNALLATPADAKLSMSSYIGFVPLALICIGLNCKETRRLMLPWLILACAFFALRLGSTLNVNGVDYPNILLPKYYMNEVSPYIFKAFNATRRFNIGFFLPYCLLAGYGVVALRFMRPSAARPWVILLAVGFIALEYHVPVVERVFQIEEYAYIDWLNQENADEIRVINVPMGRTNSKRYMLDQAVSGFSQVEGAISRTPGSAYDYIHANSILDSWWSKAPLSCDVNTREVYLSALGRLESDGFSHVVFHQKARYRDLLVDGLANAQPSYRDDYVWIYRLDDLRDSCAA